MYLNKLIHTIILEQDFKGKGKSKILIDAIKQRHPVTFYYTGPQTPKKDSVLPGTRVRAEIVAMGLSKKGNLIVRAWVAPPSTSKKGFSKTNWRTFMVSRMSSLRVLNDETFDDARPDYKNGDDDSMTVTYVTSDWTKTPKPETEPTPQSEPTPQVEPTKPQPKPTSKPETKPEELPQPKPQEKPSVVPQQKDYSSDVYQKMQPSVKNDEKGQKYITPSEFQKMYDELYKAKQKEWVDAQRQLGKNTSPGEGTRKRFDIDANNELAKLLNKDNIKVQDEENQQLSESILRIKSLMLF
jgi:hypothetical protein